MLIIIIRIVWKNVFIVEQIIKKFFLLKRNWNTKKHNNKLKYKKKIKTLKRIYLLCNKKKNYLNKIKNKINHKKIKFKWKKCKKKVNMKNMKWLIRKQIQKPKQILNRKHEFYIFFKVILIYFIIYYNQVVITSFVVGFTNKEED